MADEGIFSRGSLQEVYDGLAATYAGSRDLFDNSRQLQALDRLLPRGGCVLDLGCGTGVPVARFFAERGHRVTGVDLSPQMVERARLDVPGASFQVGDVRQFQARPGSLDLVVSFYALFHLSRADQQALFPRVREALAPGGHFYATFAAPEYTGSEGFEGTKEFEGVRLPYGQLSPEQYRQALADAGFVDVHAHKLRLGGETMLWILCRRPPG